MRALSGEATRNESVSCLQSRAWSFAYLGRFARRTKKKDRLLVVYQSGRSREVQVSKDALQCPSRRDEWK